MALTFNYKVRDKNANIVTGSLTGDTEAIVIQKLKEMDYTIVGLSPKLESPRIEEIFDRFELFQRVKSKDLTLFCRQLATMINAGLPLTRSLSILKEQTSNANLSKVIDSIRRDVEAGQAFSASLGKHPKVFSPLFINLVKAGEAGGVLDQVLLRLADHYEKETALKSKIKAAMAYPAAMFAFTLVIAVIMVTFVVPIFENLFSQLGGELPLPTKILIALSRGIRTYWWVIIPALFGIVYAVRSYKKTAQGRLLFDQIKLKLPVFGSLFAKMALARFTRTLGTLISSGISILEALEIVGRACGNEIINRATQEARASIKEGETIAQPLSRNKIFPAMVIQMIAVGEETGALGDMCLKIADFYDAEISATVETLTSLIEPVMIVVLGVIVGSMIVSLYMPMFKLINLINK